MSLNNEEIAQMRVEYSLRTFDVGDLMSDPFSQFGQWITDAISAKVNEPNAMTLATVKANNQPAARVVLLKGMSESGFVFYTNYQSAKGKELTANPHVALVFCWLELQRQVRIEGIAEKIAAHESDAYYHSRPLGSRIGAHASPQSEVIGSREELEARYSELDKIFREKSMLRPENWGGYVVRPTSMEFWQGRASRLHDRFLYTPGKVGWDIKRLAP